MDELISVIVATYNREDALDAVLRSLSRQTDKQFEVVVADDGSRAATAQLVASWTSRMPVSLKHVWHEDRGFRLAESGNRALLSRALSERILAGGLDPECWGIGRFLAHRWQGDVNRVTPMVRLPLGPLRKVRARRWR